jgi:uncharacterized membrane protein
MNRNKQPGLVCAICGEVRPRSALIPAAIVRHTVADLIRAQHPAWSSDSYICHVDLGRFRGQYVQTLLEDEKGELTALEQEVVQSLQEHDLISANIDIMFDQKLSFGERLADKIAALGGSWRFLIGFGVFLLLWIAANSVAFFWRPADPYPFILLNLILSCLAAVQAPIIMMSQNRQEEKDRVRAEHDYRVNLKSELEIRHLHEKIDHLLLHQWERLVEIQQVQLELLNELSDKPKRPQAPRAEERS